MTMRASVIWLTALLLVAVVAGCGGAATAAVPAELLGTWKTDAPSHAHAFLRIDATEIVFGTSEPQPDRHTIVGVDSEPEPSGTLYTIMYRVDDKVAQLAVSYEQVDGPALRLRNRPGFSWRRQRPS